MLTKTQPRRRILWRPWAGCVSHAVATTAFRDGRRAVVLILAVAGGGFYWASAAVRRLNG